MGSEVVGSKQMTSVLRDSVIQIRCSEQKWRSSIGGTGDRSAIYSSGDVSERHRNHLRKDAFPCLILRDLDL